MAGWHMVVSSCFLDCVVYIFKKYSVWRWMSIRVEMPQVTLLTRTTWVGIALISSYDM